MAWQDTLPLTLRSVKGFPLDATDMDLNFTRIGAMLCDIVAGHNHDGVNSKAVTPSAVLDLGGSWIVTEDTITGGANSRIISGKLESTDWGTDAGAQIDLINRTMKFGGSAAPKFSVSATGVLTTVDAVLSGSLSASTIDIGATGTNSFHVDIDGNVWSGATTFAAAPYSVSYAGAFKALNATITGTITGSIVQTAANGARVIMDTSGLRAYNSGLAQTVDISVDGSGWFGLTAARVISWTTAGATSMSGFTLSTTSLSITASGKTTTVSSGAVAFSAGTTGSPEFSVTDAGALVATNAAISGAISAATIDIGGADSTSFHVDIDGNVWSGAALFANATYSVSSAGLLRATGAVISGNLTASQGVVGGFTVDTTEGLYAGVGVTRVQMKPGIGIWCGATTFAAATFSASAAGKVNMTDATINAGTGRIVLGEIETGVFGIQGKDSLGEVIFEMLSTSDRPYLGFYADTADLELELMKANFRNISWAQFAIFDGFADSTKRAVPETATYPARVFKNRLDNGGDTTASRTFGFTSITYSNITNVGTGTSTAVGASYLEDTAKAWFTNECKNLTLIDSTLTEFNVDSNDEDTLTLPSGTPTAGAYVLQTDPPQYAVAFGSFLDSTNGGYGYVKLEVSFDAGANWQTFIDTKNSIDLREGTVLITYPGRSYVARITLENNVNGLGPVVNKFLVCTDPSPWRF